MSTFDESNVVRDKGGRFDEKRNTPPAVTLGDNHVVTTLADVKPGDALYDENGFIGVASFTHEVIGTFLKAETGDFTKPQTRVVLANSAALRGDADDTVYVDNSGAPRPYSPELTYWENVTAAHDTRQDPDVLYQIAVDESEDDFMVAICRNPASRADAIDEAAKHHSFAVRHAAIAHPNISDETLMRILNDAIQGEAEGRMRVADEGVSPMRDQYIWEADENALLAAEVRARAAQQLA